MIRRSRRDASTLIALVTLAVAALVAACTGEPGGAPGPEADGVAAVDDTAPDRSARTGAAGPSPVPVGLAVPGADPEAVEAVAARAGVRPGVVRVFARWDTPFPEPRHQGLLDAGYDLHLSVRPRTDAGVVVPWADLARAEPGDDVYRDLVAWADRVVALGGRIWFTLNHEPETRDSAANGTAEEFAAAWRRMAEVVRERGGDDVPLVFTAGRGLYAGDELDRWWPGDDVVDVVGVDAYNWFDCQGTDRPWVDAPALLAPAYAFAAQRGLPVAVGEIASTEDPADPGRKARWIDDLGRHLAEPEVAATTEYVAWFSVHDRNWPDCRWEIDSSPRSTEAFNRLLEASRP